MENKVMNFKRMEVVGRTKDEALEGAPFFIQGDATQAYKKWQAKLPSGTAVTDTMVKEFMLDYLKKKSKFAPGTGFSITLESAVVDSRQRPYKINNVKSEGRRKFKTTYVLIGHSGETVGMCQTTQKEAENIVKNLMKDGKLREGGRCLVEKKVIEGETVAFTWDYTPSKGSHNGRYLVFGIENA